MADLILHVVYQFLFYTMMTLFAFTVCLLNFCPIIDFKNVIFVMLFSLFHALHISDVVGYCFLLRRKA
jgi:hypothetical protein